MGRLDGKVALITGGAQGMGKSHVRHFVAEGARVVFGDVLDDKGAAVAAKLPEGSCRYVHHDVTSEDQWTAAVQAALDEFGTLHVLVNNAGVLKSGAIAKMPLEDFKQVLEVNAVGCWLGMKSVIDPMTAAGGGSIINISSIEGFTGAAGLSAYSASKFAIRGMTKAAAQELGGLGIRVNSVHPGGVLTSMVLAQAEHMDPAEGEAFLKSMPLARMAEPIEVSRLVAFLASDDSSYSTGSEFTADGGILSGPGYKAGPLCGLKEQPGMDETLSLEGRAAIVTGAGNGLGRAEARALARAGARVVLNDLAPDDVQAVADEIKADGGQAIASPGDIGEWRTGEQLVTAALGTFGRLDILVNNAGVLRDRMIFTMSAEEWDLVIRVHLRGHFVTTRLATTYWRDQSKREGGPVYARIVNTSSEAFLLGSPGQPNYAAAKAGIAALTVTTARSCARYGVRANAICPRARTAMTAGLMGAPPEGAADPLAPEHVAPLVTYLAGPAAAGINGEVFVVHGGVAAVMEPPKIRQVFHAPGDGPADGMWTLEAVHQALSPAFAGDPPPAGFACEDTLALASETIGFGADGASS